MRPFYFKINAKCNICTDLHPQSTLSQSERSLMSHDFMLSVQRLRVYVCTDVALKAVTQKKKKKSSNILHIWSIFVNKFIKKRKRLRVYVTGLPG